MKILLAEDEKELSRAVTAILEHAKYSVDAAYNGVDALELSENNAYDDGYDSDDAANNHVFVLEDEVLFLVQTRLCFSNGLF